MAYAKLAPKNGAVALPSGYGGTDFQSFTVTENQAHDDVTIYGTNVYGANLGNGTPIQSVSVIGFAGAHATGTQPGFASTNGSGGAATFTLDTGVTLAGSYMVPEIKLTHARIRAAVTVEFQLLNSSDVTVTWATS